MAELPVPVPDPGSNCRVTERGTRQNSLPGAPLTITMVELL